MRAIAASVLIFEAIVVVLAIPVAISLGDVDPVVAGVGGGVVIALCFVAAALLRSPAGYALGWVVQALLIASGFVVTAMFIVGALFAALWVLGLRIGRRGEELHSERWADVDNPAPEGGQPSS